MGIDGCRGGWVACLAKGRYCEFRFAAELKELLLLVEGPGVVLVDMIIGLPGKSAAGVRRCDQLARQRLGAVAGRRVFSAPPSAALEASEYAEACRLTKVQCGKAFSKQAWYLLPKVRELAACLKSRAASASRLTLAESHPELAFLRLNGGVPVLAKKKTEAGQAARIQLLSKHFNDFEMCFTHFLEKLPRSVGVADDLLDAAALLALGRVCHLLPEKLGQTDVGQMVY